MADLDELTRAIRNTIERATATADGGVAPDRARNLHRAIALLWAASDELDELYPPLPPQAAAEG